VFAHRSAAGDELRALASWQPLRDLADPDIDAEAEALYQLRAIDAEQLTELTGVLDGIATDAGENAEARQLAWSLLSLFEALKAGDTPEVSLLRLVSSAVRAVRFAP
jgi:hypothetical protein